METGDIVLVSLREYEDDKADIIHKYYEGEAVQLIRAKEIPDTGITTIFSSSCCFSKHYIILMET